MTRPEIEAAVSKFIREIGEHSDAVQVLLCYNEEGESVVHYNGGGSWRARIGMMTEMLNIDKARAFHQVKKDEYPDE